jgi:endonuclease VIII
VEGPSLVIACEELNLFKKKKIINADGSAAIPFSRLKGSFLQNAQSWGKHLLLSFTHLHLRIHFLMFGSYRINKPRPNRIPKLRLDYGDQQIFFYSCAIKELETNFKTQYDWSIDLMSSKWDAKKALKAIRAKPKSLVCDLLMDQTIFSGLGNIMKNETLYNLKIHPETKIDQLTPSRQKKLVTEAHAYAWRFYDWKKQNILKRNWKIMRKKKCPLCGGKVTKKHTGKLKRLSHFCPRCQQKH